MEEHRREKQDRGKALAGKSTMNRLELTKREVFFEERYKKISVDNIGCVGRALDELSGSWRKSARSGFGTHSDTRFRLLPMRLYLVRKQPLDYVIGLAKNERLIREIEGELKKAEEQFQKTG